MNNIPVLDRSKPVCVVTPPYKGAVVNQGDHYFDAGDEYLFSNGGVIRADETGAGEKENGGGKKLPPASEPEPASNSTPPPNEPDTQADTSAPTDSDTLVAWAKKEQNIQFFKVRAMAKKVFPESNVKSGADMCALLVSKGLMDQSEIRR